MSDWKQQLVVQLETVTPLFLGGADPRGEPELRPPAFRGAMRYWFRAALGGVIGDSNLDGLRKLEREVFGNAEYGSPVAVRVRQVPCVSDVYPILPHKMPSGRRRAFNSKQQFEVILDTTRLVDPLVWVNACMAFNLAIWLGGLGLRSRRGAGSLRVVKSTDPSLVPVFPDDPDLFPRLIEKVLRSAVGMGRKLHETISTTCNFFAHHSNQFSLCRPRCRNSLCEGLGEDASGCHGGGDAQNTQSRLPGRSLPARVRPYG